MRFSFVIVLLSASSCSSFVSHTSPRSIPGHLAPLAFSLSSPDHDFASSVSFQPEAPGLSVVYQAAGVASAAAWTALAVVALSHHPDPRFIHCSVKHNILTIAQALAFPLSVLYGVFNSLSKASKMGWTQLESATHRRLNLGLVGCLGMALISTLRVKGWTGYCLYPQWLQLSAAGIFYTSAVVAYCIWKRSVVGLEEASSLTLYWRILRGSVASLWCLAPVPASDDPNSSSATAALWSTITAGFLWLTVQPLVVSFPLATIPSILGRRLSRPASAFYLLAAVQAYCLKTAADQHRLTSSLSRTLRRWLGTGSALHGGLIVLKLIGMDDGGLLLVRHGVLILWNNSLHLAHACLSLPAGPRPLGVVSGHDGRASCVDCIFAHSCTLLPSSLCTGCL